MEDRSGGMRERAPAPAEEMPDGVTVQFVPAWTTWPLRQEVLRPGRAVRDCLYPGENDPRAAHAAALQRQRPAADFTVLAVGVLLPEPPPWQPDDDDGWRLRGMATRPDVRGRGIGSWVLDLLVGAVVDGGGGLLWCHARTPALHLYERAGFLPRGDVFEIPEIGPHQLMWRIVEPR